MSLVTRLKLLYRTFFPRPEIVLLDELKSRRLEQTSFDFTLPNGMKASGLSPMEAYNEYKDLFIHGIYDFTAKNDSPLILDGGAYVGFSALWFKSKYPNAKLKVFECDPGIIEKLNKNIEQNNLKDIEVVPAALFRTNGTTSFSANGADSGTLLKESKDKNISVNTVRLSEHLNQEVDFLKLNIEGAEFEVLKEAKRDLHKVREMIIEFHSFAGLEQRLQELLSTLTECGFRYMLNHFDYESNYAVKPPFKLSKDTTYILLVYAKRNDLL